MKKKSKSKKGGNTQPTKWSSDKNEFCLIDDYNPEIESESMSFNNVSFLSNVQSNDNNSELRNSQVLKNNLKNILNVHQNLLQVDFDKIQGSTEQSSFISLKKSRKSNNSSFQINLLNQVTNIYLHKKKSSNLFDSKIANQNILINQDDNQGIYINNNTHCKNFCMANYFLLNPFDKQKLKVLKSLDCYLCNKELLIGEFIVKIPCCYYNLHKKCLEKKPLLTCEKCKQLIPF